MKEEILRQYKEWRATYRNPDFSLDYDGMSDNILDFVQNFSRGELATFFEEIFVSLDKPFTEKEI